MRENVKLWLKQSLEDLDTARVLLNNNKYYVLHFIHIKQQKNV